MLLQAERWRVEPWQVVYLCEIGSRAWFIHIAVVTLAFLAQGDTGTLAQLWLAGMVVLSLVICGMCQYAIRRKSADDRWLIRAGWAHTFLTTLVALFWFLGAVLAARSSFENLLLYSFALGGTALGAVSSQHSVLRSCFISIWIGLLGLAVAHILLDPGAAGAINAGMIVLYGGALSILAVRMNRFLLSNRGLARNLDAQLAELSREHQRAEEANQAKTRFLANASHDLRQPVHAIGMLTTILRQSSLNDEARELVDRIDASVDSLSGLFQSLLDVSAVDLGRVVPRSEVFNLGGLLNQLAIQNAPLIEKQGGSLRLVPTKHWVETDPRILANVIQNLLTNAAKYAPGHAVLLGVRRCGEELAIVVADQGPGIPQSEQQLVFQEFYRVAGKSGGAAQGLGLGLPLVARFAALLGLRHRLESEPGKGTMVRISGLRPTEARKRGTTARPAVAHRLTGLHVHVTDDDADIRQAMVELLESWGCVVSSSAGVPYTATGADMLVTDYDLGDMHTGAECIAAVRAQEGFAVPALVVTGVAGFDQHRLDGLEPVRLLAKPARPAQLRAALMSLALEHAGSDADQQPRSRPNAAAAERDVTLSARNNADA